MSGFSKKASNIREMFDKISPRYDLLNSILSFGLHKIWRRKLISRIPHNTDLIALDLCTGTGECLPLLERRCREVYGVDFSFEMLLRAKKRFNSAKLIQGDGLRLPFKDKTFDVVAVAFGVRNFEDLTSGLKEILRVLKEGGLLLVLEFGTPGCRFFNLFYRLYSRYVMPVIGGIISGNRSAYTYLPETSRVFPCRGEFNRCLLENGFTPVEYHSYSFGVVYSYVGIKKEFKKPAGRKQLSVESAFSNSFKNKFDTP